jgi:hAT family C-terminal dimerisation region
MTSEQFDNAERDLIERLQSMREGECGARALVTTSGGGSEHIHDENDDIYEQPISTEHQEAQNEWRAYCDITKKFCNFPKKYKKDSNYISIGLIEFGTVETKGDDMVAFPGSSFKTCNLANFMSGAGYFDIIAFLTYNQNAFPYIYKLACCLASLRTHEVGCERFFSIAGYVSNPRRARLKVKHYETIATLKRNMQQIYIDEDVVVQEYMEMEKKKSWDQEQAVLDEQVTSYEREVYARDLGILVNELPLELTDEKQFENDEVSVQSISDSDTDSE